MRVVVMNESYFPNAIHDESTQIESNNEDIKQRLKIQRERQDGKEIEMQKTEEEGGKMRGIEEIKSTSGESITRNVNKEKGIASLHSSQHFIFIFINYKKFVFLY